ncbi:cache domain-containing protein [Thermovirga lienii]|uniref:cache domain-containing protein n=1 Tax=Thermovirga lienii TaxID=336261 RepID=UPI000EEA632A|nr:hypothetical protein [Thermovirga lienii]
MVSFFRSIRSRFIAFLVLIVALFLGLLLVFTYSSLKDAALRNAKELSRAAMRQTKGSIDIFFSELERLARALAKYPAFKNVDTTVMREIVLAEVEARKEYLRAIYLGTKDGKMYEWGIGPGFVNNSPIFEPHYDPRERPWFKRALEKGEFSVSDPYLYASFPALGITAVLPVYDDLGDFVGVLGLDILLEDLQKMVKNFKIEKNGKVIILNRDNHVIVSQFDDEKDGKNTKLETFDLFNIANLANHKDSYVVESHKMGKRYLISTTEDQRTGWKIIVALPYDEVILLAIRNIKGIIVLEVLLTIFLGFALLVMSNNIIIHPLRDAIEVIEATKVGDATVRMPEDRKDEFGVLAREFNRLIEAVREYQRELEEKVKDRTKRIIELQKENLRLRLIEEKERIYGYLHDSLGARLTNINISNAVAQKVVDKDKKMLKDMLQRIETNTRLAISDLREILKGSTLDSRRMIDFCNVLHANVKSRLELKDIELEWHSELDPLQDEICPKVRLEFEKILQELTSNVLKHSEAKNVRVFFSLDEDKLRLEYSDDGVGGALVDPEKKGYGLAGIAERVKMLGGEFKVNSPKGGGTKVVILLPNRGRREEL